MQKAYYKSPIGLLKIVGDNEGIHEISFVEEDVKNDEYILKNLIKCIKQLDEFFNKKRKKFEVPLVLKGTPFQIKVWKALMEIPYGETVSYKNIAISIGNEKAIRAVGNANNKNKIPIIIPCHRVIGSNGKLVGYAGGVWRKEWLIDNEK